MKPMPYSMSYSGMPFCEASFSNKATAKLDKILALFDRIREGLSKDVDINTYRRPEQTKLEDWKNFYVTVQPKILSMTDLFKDLENEFNNVFGFHSTVLDFVYTFAGVGNYNQGKDGDRSGYDYGMINAWTYVGQRYYIDGLLSEDGGFYDSTHSLNFHMEIYPHAFVALTSRELLAVILHEVGHNLDPALVDIGYQETNELVNYLGNKTTDEHVYRWIKLHLEDIPLLGPFIAAFRTAVSGTKNYEDRLKKATENQLNLNQGWNYSNSIEAFADNIPRMYGLGKDLISGLVKIGDDMDAVEGWSFSYLENLRQNEILACMAAMADMNEEHATIIHRIKSLLMEYDKELADPKLPAPLRKRIQEDRDGVNALLQQLLNSPNEVKRKAYNIINTTIDEYNARSNGTSTPSPNEKKGANPYDMKVDTPDSTNEGDPNDIVIP
jgi:hypothetical protein|nr:MAG TPA: hypothetical protein [Caudoviricetes sp.]